MTATTAPRTARALADACPWPSGQHREVRGTCTRCGASAAPALSAALIAKFDRILDLEHEARVTRALGGMIVGDSAAVLRRDQERLFAAIDALTPAEAVAFGAYRAAQQG